jgi:SAM-dependent MidA family methyltransferase
MSPLGELIAERIRTGGPISFAEFMELSLYHPEHGYYARAAQRTGRAGDFFTSVDVGPVFGELLAKQFAEMWRILQNSPKLAGEFEGPAGAADSLFFDLVEAGAGNGRLSRDVLDAAAGRDPEFYAAIRLSLVEQSPAARAAQAGTLGPHAARLHHSASSLGGLPEPIRGVIFANELLDALPTHAVAMTENGLREVFFDYRDGRFVECLKDLSTPRIAAYLSRAGASLAAGWRAEVNLAAEDWVKTAARSLRKGFLVMIDYGHEEGELYGASHSSGTLTMFKQHTTEFDVQEPGTYDITAHVDLSAVRRAAEREGMQVLGRLDQTYFLMGLGLDELQDMANSPQSFEPAALGRRLALKTLILPGGLGSTHKVLIFGKDVGAPRLRGVAYRERLT